MTTQFKNWFKQNSIDATQWQHAIGGFTCLIAKTEKFWFSTTPETNEWCVSDRTKNEMILREGTFEDAAKIWAQNLETTYISFCGTFNVPTNANSLAVQYPMQYEESFEGTDSNGDDIYQDIQTGFRNGLIYEEIDGKDSLTVYLAKIDDMTGHLVASCPAGGWSDETFVFLGESGCPVKSADNFNPNPVEQLCEV